MSDSADLPVWIAGDLVKLNVPEAELIGQVVATTYYLHHTEVMVLWNDGSYEAYDPNNLKLYVEYEP